MDSDRIAQLEAEMAKMSVVDCKNCHGALTGQLDPSCVECGGAGFITQEMVEVYIASILDGNSVYMSGPSPASRRTARKIIEMLMADGLLNTAPKDQK